MKNYVYLIKSKRKLVITANQIEDDDYHQMCNSEGIGSITFLKMFCLGVLSGQQLVGYTLTNSMEEFQ